MIFYLFKDISFDSLLTNHLSCKNALKIEVWTLKNKQNDTFLSQREISIKTLNKNLIFLINKNLNIKNSIHIQQEKMN